MYSWHLKPSSRNLEVTLYTGETIKVSDLIQRVKKEVQSRFLEDTDPDAWSDGLAEGYLEGYKDGLNKVYKEKEE